MTFKNQFIKFTSCLFMTPTEDRLLKELLLEVTSFCSLSAWVFVHTYGFTFIFFWKQCLYGAKDEWIGHWRSWVKDQRSSAHECGILWISCHPLKHLFSSILPLLVCFLIKGCGHKCHIIERIFIANVQSKIFNEISGSDGGAVHQNCCNCLLCNTTDRPDLFFFDWPGVILVSCTNSFGCVCFDTPY